MKITRINPILVEPRWLFVKVSTDKGITGWGESLGDRAETVKSAIKELKRYLIGKDPTKIENHWQTLYRGYFWRGGPILNSAISGIEIALWDIFGKKLDIPIYKLLGGKCREKIKVYANIGSEEESEKERWLKYGYKKGWMNMIKKETIKAIKFCPFPAMKSIESWNKMKNVVKKVKKMRERIGDNIDLLIECHGRLTPSMAITFCEEIRQYHPFFVEEPCLPENMDAMANVTSKVKVPIATGERIYTKFGFFQLLDKTKVAVVQPDLGICGGIMEGKKISAMAESKYVAVAPHSPYGPILTAASLQLDACIPNFLIQEYCSLGEGILKKPFEIKNGYIDLPKSPGLGIEIDEEKLKKRPYKQKYLPRLHYENGSLADW